MDKISVIIPVYNVESYIRKCLDSVINQTHNNLEILCIDDGSTDKSGIICDEYAKKDNRISVFHKTNGGVGSARNVGLINLSGDYVGFVDSDDWLEPDMYEVLYNVLVENGVTFSVVSYTMEYDDYCKPATARERIPERVLEKKEMLLYAIRGIQYAGFDFSCCNKLFDANTINLNRLFFCEDALVGEDAKFTTSVILTENCTGYFINKPMYHYYQRSGSAMNTELAINRLERMRALNDIANMVDKEGYSEITIWLKRDCCYLASLVAEEAIKNLDSELLTKMQENISGYLNEYIKANEEYPDRIERIRYLLQEDSLCKA